jgi:hypothetical protein
MCQGKRINLAGCDKACSAARMGLEASGRYRWRRCCAASVRKKQACLAAATAADELSTMGERCV